MNLEQPKIGILYGQIGKGLYASFFLRVNSNILVIQINLAQNLYNLKGVARSIHKAENSFKWNAVDVKILQ